ncbi:hypothetical protein CA13_16130 [Planctomycetes bacterium CA13]|uniref:Uncharacterized protein n=1 Tax=Novipirellula herctigrandis TaxID=2527986 RepID=A0A5C5YZ21_9BACT|nr:hypothetical protein CA13_16130 [Planctomycetes bacterium CA13]
MRLLTLKTLILAVWVFSTAGLLTPVFAVDLESIQGTYRRLPYENDWHVGSIEVVAKDPVTTLRWRNKANVSWNLIPSLEHGILKTDESNPYFKQGQPAFHFKLRDGKVIGFTFQNDLYVRDGVKIMPQMSGGFHGYISMRAESPPPGYGYGASFYISIWPLLEDPLAHFQIGLPSTWIVPDNRDFKQPLCPPGTVARDNWHERGPYYRNVFQTIEGGLGYWGSTRFRSATPKYRMNGTPNGYNHEISSPGWGFGKTVSLTSEEMGIAQLSNRLVVPPDGMTFTKDVNGEVLGNAWMVLPMTSSKQGPETPTGDQSWTLFLNTANFKGPVAFWIPETWSRLSRGYKTIAGRGLDARPGLMGSGAMEVNTVPYFESIDESGTTYSKIPQLQFPINDRGETILMQDVTFYAKQAFTPTGVFDLEKSWKPKLTANPISFQQGPDRVKLTEIDQVVQTKIFGNPGEQAFGLQWTTSRGRGNLPEYYKQVGTHRIATTAEQVPKETGIVEQAFSTTSVPQSYRSPDSGIWKDPGPKSEAFKAALTDGSVVTYAWYRFVDQPSIQALNWSAKEKEKVQKLVERIHRLWPIDRDYMPLPTRGTLVAMDDALIVSPPEGLEIGYVPIAIDQSPNDPSPNP